jgi:hypothetical protein
MGKWFAALDKLLRGEFTRAEELREGRIRLPTRTLVTACLALGATYGLCMGMFSATGGREGSWRWLLSAAGKVPLLFLFTLVVTFPSLYVFAALANSRLRVRDTLRLLVAAIAVNLGVLASFGPVTAFFTVSTDSYTFMILLNVLFFTVAGAVGLGFLNRAVGAVFPAEPLRGAHQDGDAAVAERAAEHAARDRARRIFRVWLLLYGVVGAQMGWILRPFIGNPHLPFQMFRARWSNVFEFLMRTVLDRW